MQMPPTTTQQQFISMKFCTERVRLAHSAHEVRGATLSFLAHKLGCALPLSSSLPFFSILLLSTSLLFSFCKLFFIYHGHGVMGMHSWVHGFMVHGVSIGLIRGSVNSQNILCKDAQWDKVINKQELMLARWFFFLFIRVTLPCSCFGWRHNGRPPVNYVVNILQERPAGEYL